MLAINKDKSSCFFDFHSYKIFTSFFWGQPSWSLKMWDEMAKCLSRRDQEVSYPTWHTDIPERLNQENSSNCKVLRFTNKCNKPKHRQKSSKWFGRECHEMRSKLKQECHALNRNSDNPQLRGQYFQCKGMYKSIYRNRRENLNRILSQILKICIIQRANFWRDLLKQFHKKKENRVEKENLPSIQSLSKHYQNLL